MQLCSTYRVRTDKGFTMGIPAFRLVESSTKCRGSRFPFPQHVPFLTKMRRKGSRRDKGETTSFAFWSTFCSLEMGEFPQCWIILHNDRYQSANGPAWTRKRGPRELCFRDLSERGSMHGLKEVSFAHLTGNSRGGCAAAEAASYGKAIAMWAWYIMQALPCAACE